MRKRVNNPNDSAYKNYGGRGIGICGRWDKFKNFEEDMLPTYKEGLWLERRDNDGDYSPENCYWATPMEQQNNRRNNHFVEFNNKKQTISQWARELGIKKSTLSMRYYAYGWSVEKCLTTN